LKIEEYLIAARSAAISQSFARKRFELRSVFATKLLLFIFEPLSFVW
jgi:hypothetical protein